jgi:hypothetical protein
MEDFGGFLDQGQPRIKGGVTDVELSKSPVRDDSPINTREGRGTWATMRYVFPSKSALTTKYI